MQKNRILTFKLYKENTLRYNKPSQLPCLFKMGQFCFSQINNSFEATPLYGRLDEKEREDGLMKQKNSRVNVRTITMTGLFGALSAVLMMFSFSIPVLMPSFIKMDFSELPALIAAFAMGPLSGAMVCLIKNLINVMFTTTGGVGELSNFILGCMFVIPAGFIYKRNKTKRSALIGSIVGAVVMAVVSVISNYFIVYPVYTMFMPMDAIIAMYHAINPHVNTLLQALIMFNMPFTFIKGMFSVVITFLVYKHISPIIKGTHKY